MWPEAVTLWVPMMIRCRLFLTNSWRLRCMLRRQCWSHKGKTQSTRLLILKLPIKVLKKGKDWDGQQGVSFLSISFDSLNPFLESEAEQRALEKAKQKAFNISGLWVAPCRDKELKTYSIWMKVIRRDAHLHPARGICVRKQADIDVCLHARL